VETGIIQRIFSILQHGALRTQDRSVFRLFNPEPTATAANREKNTVAIGLGLNDPLPILDH
jgi:hypothetical protein